MDFSIPERVREIAGTIRSLQDREVVPLKRQAGDGVDQSRR